MRKPAEAQQSMLNRLAKGDGYLNFVLSSNDIEADSAAMRQRGVAIIGPNGWAAKCPMVRPVAGRASMLSVPT